jgi:hypothetical protein
VSKVQYVYHGFLTPSSFLDALALQMSSSHVPRNLPDSRLDWLSKLETRSSRVYVYMLWRHCHFVGIKSILGELSYVVGDSDTATLIIIRMKYDHKIEYKLSMVERCLAVDPLKNTVLFLIFVRPTALEQNLSTYPFEEYSPVSSSQPAETLISAQFETRLSENIAGVSEVRYIHSLWTNPEKAKNLAWSFDAMGDVYKQKALLSK